MDIAQAKRRENIAEYILYLWQLEDLLRALQFSPEAIFSTLIAPRKDIADEQKHVFLLWYMDIANLLHQEGKDEKGHLEHTLHLIGDLHDLHLQLMKLPVGEHYRRTYARLEPELPRLRAVLGNPGMNDTELCFRALYAAMLYRIKGEGEKSAVADTLEFISPVIAELADMHGKVERGEVEEGAGVAESQKNGLLAPTHTAFKIFRDENDPHRAVGFHLGFRCGHIRRVAVNGHLGRGVEQPRIRPAERGVRFIDHRDGGFTDQVGSIHIVIQQPVNEYSPDHHEQDRVARGDHAELPDRTGRYGGQMPLRFSRCFHICRSGLHVSDGGE